MIVRGNKRRERQGDAERKGREGKREGRRRGGKKIEGE